MTWTNAQVLTRLRHLFEEGDVPDNEDILLIEEALSAKEIHRINIHDDQMIEYVVRRQDPAVAGPDARTLVTKIDVRAGDVIVVLRPPETDKEPAF